MKHKHSKDKIEEAVRQSISVSDVLRHLKIPVAGGNHSHMKRMIARLGIDTSHFLGQAAARGRLGRRKHWSELLVLREGLERRQEGKVLRRALTEAGVRYICDVCNMPPEWNGKPLTLQVHHRNGNWMDDRKENLCFICPNCHEQM